MASSRKSLVVDYKQLHSFSSVVLYDTATRTRNRGRFFDVERVITRRKCDSVSLVSILLLVLFLLFHESASSFCIEVFCVSLLL